MQLVNFDECKRPDINKQKHYGGLSGNKEHVLIDEENYFLKYPNKLTNIKDRYTNVVLSYTNSPLSEYLGSHIYEILGFNVHKTVLGVSEKRKHVLVACKDFLNPGDILDEFKNIKVSYAPTFDENENSSGSSCNFKNVLDSIQSNTFLQSIPGIESHFWNMFVVDALIGNSDRNNGNWGIIRHLDGTNEISPVYDNGNSFNNKWDSNKFEQFIADNNKFKTEAFVGKTCIFTKTDKDGLEKPINPFKIIASQEYPLLNEAIKRIVPKIFESHEKIISLINEIPENYLGIQVITPIQKKFYRNIIRTRYNEVLKPTYENLINPEKKIEIKFKSNILENHHNAESNWDLLR